MFKILELNNGGAKVDIIRLRNNQNHLDIEVSKGEFNYDCSVFIIRILLKMTINKGEP
jgi:hypothetical protein